MYDNVVIENKYVKAIICPKRGANLIYFYDKSSKTSVLRTPKSIDDFEKFNPFLYGTPFLFPPNRISNAKFVFEGRVYQFPVNEESTNCFVHGSMHSTKFNVIEQNGESVTCIYESGIENPYYGFINNHIIEIEYRLCEEKIIQNVSITNNSNMNMPCGIGFHTTFALDKLSNEVCLSAAVDKKFIRGKNFLPTGEYLIDDSAIRFLNEGKFPVKADNYSDIFELSDNHDITINDVKKRIKIHYLLDEKYKYIMLFNMGSNGDYICIEPQSWLTDSPNLKLPKESTGFISIEPYKRVSFTSTLYVESNY